MEKELIFEINEGKFEAKNYLAKRYPNLAHEKVVPEFFAQNYAAISAQKADFGNGKPSALYFSWNIQTSTTDLAIALPLKNIPRVISNNFELITFPESKCFYIDYYGTYALMEPAHTALTNFIQSKQISGKFVAIEEYITDPSSESNSKKCLTKISYVKL